MHRSCFSFHTQYLFTYQFVFKETVNKRDMCLLHRICAHKNLNNTVCYHNVHKSVAIRESLTTYIDDNENPTDLLIKVLCDGKRRYSKINYCMILICVW